MRRTYWSFTMGDMVKNSTVVPCTYYCIHLFASPSKLDALVRLSLHGGGKVSLTFISSATSWDFEDTLLALLL